MTAPTNAPVELARYSTSGDGERVVRAQRIDGAVRLSDVPARATQARRFVIERELLSMGELDAIVADYLEQAARWDAIPALPRCFEAEREQ